jgi:uncharacterized paraquat-inducible protein A
MHFFKKKTTPTSTPLVTLDTIDQTLQNGYGSQSVSPPNGMSNHTLHTPISKHVITTRKSNCCQRCCTKENLKEQALLIATIASVILGIIVGIALRDLKCITGNKIKI